MSTRADNKLLCLKVGEPCDVEHEDGKGSTETVTGKLLDSDDQGYVVIETQDGYVVYVPKARVIRIKQSIKKGSY